MAETVQRKRVLATLFPLLILAIVLTGIQSAHQWLDTPTQNHASTADSHRHLGAAQAHDEHAGDLGSGSEFEQQEPAPACHELGDPLATSPDRCPARDSDQDLTTGTGTAVDWPSSGHPRADCQGLTRGRPALTEGRRLSTLCVLRL